MTQSQIDLLIKMQSGVILTVQRSDTKWVIEGFLPELECSLSDGTVVNPEDVCILAYNMFLEWPKENGKFLHFEPMIASLTEKGLKGK